MRTTKIIQAEIEAIRAKDRAYNRIQNEGGEGYERDSVPEALKQEWLDAEKAEFAATWTLEVLMARRAAWNDAVARRAPKTSAAVAQIQRDMGYTLADIKRAKALHGIA